MKQLFALLLLACAQPALAVHICITQGLMFDPATAGWDTSFPRPTEAAAVAWAAPGLARRIDGLTTPLFAMYCATGAGPVLGSLVWADGETADIPVAFIKTAAASALLILPGSMIALP